MHTYHWAILKDTVGADWEIVKIHREYDMVFRTNSTIVYQKSDLARLGPEIEPPTKCARCGLETIAFFDGEPLCYEHGKQWWVNEVLEDD